MNKHLKILLLEDSQDDADLIQLKLKEGGINFTSLVVDTKSDYIDGIRDFNPDVILSDHALPQFNSAEALKIYKSHQKAGDCYATFILVTGAVSEEFAVQCIKDGADDYILKDRLQRLPIAITNTLEKRRVENEKLKATAEKLLLLERYEHLTNATSQAIWDWDIEKNSIYCGKGFENIFGHAYNPLIQNDNLNTAWISAGDIERVMSGIDAAVAGNTNNWCDEYQYLKGNGEYAFVYDCAVIIRNTEGRAVRMIGAMQDITGKKNENLRLKLMESVIINTTDGVIILEVQSSDGSPGSIVYVNEAFAKIKGFAMDEILGKPIDLIMSPQTDEEVTAPVMMAFAQQKAAELQMKSYKKNGEEFELHFSMAPIANDHGFCTHWVFMFRDITEQQNHLTAIEKQNLQMRDIAWTQSHTMRAPLARMMGFINLIDSNKQKNIEQTDLLPYVLQSARELDIIIRGIVEKSENIKYGTK